MRDITIRSRSGEHKAFTDDIIAAFDDFGGEQKCDLRCGIGQNDRGNRDPLYSGRSRKMDEEIGVQSDRNRSLKILAMVNVAVWAISLIALVFVMQHSPAAKGMFPILGGGAAIGISLISVASKSR